MYSHIEDGVHLIKQMLVRQQVPRHAAIIAYDMGMRWTRTLDGPEIVDIAATAVSSGKAVEISGTEMRSFISSDLVMQVRAPCGTDSFVVVVASYSGGPGDADLAVRNARYLARFTARPTYPVVATVEYPTWTRGLTDTPQPVEPEGDCLAFRAALRI